MTIRKHEVPDELLSGLLANYRKPEDLIGENGLLKQLTKLLVEKALDAEMTEHLGHDKYKPVANAVGNTRSGRRHPAPIRLGQLRGRPVHRDRSTRNRRLTPCSKSTPMPNTSRTTGRCNDHRIASHAAS
jgi:hypothetical protein